MTGVSLEVVFLAYNCRRDDYTSQMFVGGSDL